MKSGICWNQYFRSSLILFGIFNCFYALSCANVQMKHNNDFQDSLNSVASKKLECESHKTNLYETDVIDTLYALTELRCESHEVVLYENDVTEPIRALAYVEFRILQNVDNTYDVIPEKVVEIIYKLYENHDDGFKYNDKIIKELKSCNCKVTYWGVDSIAIIPFLLYIIPVEP